MTTPQPGSPPPPFALQTSPQLPELLHQLGVTLMLSTYQAGKVINRVFRHVKFTEKTVKLQSFQNNIASTKTSVIQNPVILVVEDQISLHLDLLWRNSILDHVCIMK